MRPLEKVEAKMIIPIGLSIKSGKRAPTAKYFGSIIVLSRGMKIPSPKNIPSVTPMCPKRSIVNKNTVVIYKYSPSLFNILKSYCA